MSVIALPEDWGFCGCANEDALRLLRDILRKMAEKPPGLGNIEWSRRHVAEREKLAGGPAQWELFMHYVDKMGWSEHGGGINSAWLTKSGEEALETLRGLDLEDPN